MALAQTVSQLNDVEIDNIVDLLKPLDKQIDKRLKFVMNKFHMKKNIVSAASSIVRSCGKTKDCGYNSVYCELYIVMYVSCH